MQNNLIEFIKSLEHYPTVIISFVVLAILAMCIACTWLYAIVKLFTKK